MDSTLIKGLQAYEWLVREQRAVRGAELAAALGLPRSNAHRTLQTLVAAGWVTQNPDTSSYRASPRVLEFSALLDTRAELTALLHPTLAALARESGETIHLATLEGSQVLYLDKFDSPLPVAAYSRVGGRAPAYCVASGKALLAAAGHELPALKALLGPLEAHTPRTLTSHDALLADLERARARGWAENREEWRLGVCGLGAPVYDAAGRPVAAVGMSVPSIRLSRTQVRPLAARVMACAEAASRALGYRGGAAASSPRPPAAQAPRQMSSRHRSQGDTPSRG